MESPLSIALGLLRDPQNGVLVWNPNVRYFKVKIIEIREKGPVSPGAA